MYGEVGIGLVCTLGCKLLLEELNGVFPPSKIVSVLHLQHSGKVLGWYLWSIVGVLYHFE